MAYDVVPYCTFTALVPILKEQSCFFEVAPMLPWSTHAGTATKWLCGYSMVTAELPHKSSMVT